MLKERIKNKEKLIGMYIQLTDLSIARIAGLAGYDYVWVDFEHPYMSFEDVLGHLMALKTTGTPVIVRVPQDDLTATKKIIEMGVDGIIFPMVRNVEELNRLLNMCLYPPHGERGFGPMGAIDYGFRKPFEYTANAHNELCVFVQIEHKEMVEQLDEFVKNPYVDGYIFGPNDLSGSYGILGDVFGEKITSVMREVTDKLHAAGQYVGIAAGGCTDEIVRHWSSFGVEMLTAGSDVDFLRDGAVANRARLERCHKQNQ